VKKIIFLILLLSLMPFNVGWSQIHLTTADEITISGRTLDSSGFYATPDSVRIVVYRDGAEEFDAWYNSGDAECAALNDMLVFTDAFGDIDDDAGDGLYEVMAGFFLDAGDLYYWKTIWVYVGVDMGEIADILDTLQLYDTRWDSLMQALADSHIGDKVWNEDTTGHYTPPHMGYMASQTGAGGGGADTAAIKAMHQNNPGLVIINDNLADGERVAIMPEDWTQADSNAYQGSASGLDSNKVAQAVIDVMAEHGWDIDSSLRLTYLQIKDSSGNPVFVITNQGGGDALQINALGSGDGIDINTTAGSDVECDITGTIDSVNYLKGGVSCCSGSGAKSYIIYVADSTGGDTTFLSGVVVSAYSMSGDLQAGMKTDSYGKVSYATDLDSLFLIAAKFNYYTIPDTIVVSVTGYVDTIFVYRGITPTSGSPDLCRLYGFIYDISGIPDGNATVTAWLPAGVTRFDSSIISPYRVETTTDSTGYFYIDLIPNASLIPDTSKYEITIVRTDGTILRERVSVPDQESWLLTW